MTISFHEKKFFDAKLSTLYEQLAWIQERVAKYLPQKDLDKLLLASEEVIVNIILHGYKREKGSIDIEIVINDHIELIFRDHAPKFNPLTKKNKFKPKKITKAGGVGIFIIFSLVDEVYYQRKDDKNILTFKIKRSLEY